MSKKKISYSAWDKYLTCPKMYDIHYNQRLRPGGTSSALVFGTAMDDALNCLLEMGDIDMAIDAFRASFQWEDMKDVQWDPRDTDHSIVSVDDFDTDEHLAWASMRVKGRMLLEKYYEKIYPLIEEVYDVQKELSGRPGFLDAVVKLRGYGRVLLDHKTASRPYEPDSVQNSTQLALYAKDQGIKRAGFAVLVKQIKKNTKRTCLACSFDGSYVRHKTCPQVANGVRCHGDWKTVHAPEAQVQLLVDDIPEINKELTETSVSQVETAIQQGIFPRNLRACGKIYGKPCPYYEYCRSGNKQGLEYKPEEKDGKSGK